MRSAIVYNIQSHQIISFWCGKSPKDKSKRYYAGEGRLDLKLKNGETITGYMEQPHGGPNYPLSMDAAVHIYRKYSSGILDEDLIERTKDMILNLEDEPDLKTRYDMCTFQANSN